MTNILNYHYSSFEEAKKSFIALLNELEAFGLYNAHCVKEAYPHLVSTEITSPHSSKDIKEFGNNIATYGLGIPFLKMVEKLSFESLRLCVLKEASHFLTKNYLIRVWRPTNKYPTHYYSEKIKPLGTNEYIEIVFFARSKKGAERIKNRLHFTMGADKSFQYHVDEMLENKFNEYAIKFINDDQIKIIATMHSIMTDAYAADKINQ